MSPTRRLGAAASAEALIDAVRNFMSECHPRDTADVVIIKLSCGSGKIKIVVPPLLAAPKVSQFIPNAVQDAVLGALDGRALRTDALAREAKVERSQMFKKPGGLAELTENGLLERHPRMGYYRPDSPPPKLDDDDSLS
jgi:hypothetical protein